MYSDAVGAGPLMRTEVWPSTSCGRSSARIRHGAAPAFVTSMLAIRLPAAPCQLTIRAARAVAWQIGTVATGVAVGKGVAMGLGVGGRGAVDCAGAGVGIDGEVGAVGIVKSIVDGDGGPAEQPTRTRPAMRKKPMNLRVTILLPSFSVNV